MYNLTSMKPKTTYRVCLLFKHNNRSDRDRLSGACRFAASMQDWDVRILDRSSQSFSREAAMMCRKWKPDGVIYTADSGHRPALSVIGALDAFRAEMDPPEGARDISADVSVRADAKGIISDVTSLLIRRNFRNFGFYGTEEESECDYSEMCERHFAAALARCRFKVSAFRERIGDSWSMRIGAAGRWAAGLPKPCVVLAYTDELARNLLNACRMAHLNVPDQVAILGIDDAPDICETCRPTLSSVSLDFEMSGFIAAQALDKAMRRGRHLKCHEVLYGVRAINERQSTQDTRGYRRIVGAATELIRTMPLATLSVQDVVSRLRVSRRLLEIGFKKVLGHGIHAHILRRRLATLHDRLKETRIPVGDLALSCGFKTAAAARIAYRKHYGSSMMSERKGLSE